MYIALLWIRGAAAPGSVDFCAAIRRRTHFATGASEPDSRLVERICTETSQEISNLMLSLLEVYE